MSFQRTVYCVWFVKTYTLMASWPQSFHTVMMIMICGRRTLFGHNLIWFAVTHLLQFCLADCGNGYVAWWVQLCMVQVWVCGCDWVRRGYGSVGTTGFGDVVRGRLFPDCRREDGDAVGHLHTCHNSCIHSKPTQASSHLLTDTQKERQTNKQEDIKICK